MFWRADSPLTGQAAANSSILATEARSTSMLVLPANANITHAFLYWGARLPAAGADLTVTFDREGSFSAAINALTSYQLSIPQPGNTSADFYQSVADVT